VLIPYKTEDYAQRISDETNQSGVNVIVDFIGAPNFDRNINSLAGGGRLIQVGLMAGLEGANLPLSRLVHSNLQIIGTIMKSRPQPEKYAMVQRFAKTWLPQLAEGTLKPVIDSVFPLSQAADAHRRMEQNLNSGKIILTA
jgi:NADPH:quinone reductase-like Zn-dependent oxidoreductase